jgi:hypothetical protein
LAESAVEQLLGRPIGADEEISVVRMRIVLDTNILVRANAKPEGRP